MNKQELIKYFRKQTHCPICKRKLDIEFDSRIDFLKGECWYDNKCHYYHKSNTAVFKKYEIIVNAKIKNYNIAVSFNEFQLETLISAISDEELFKQQSSYFSATKYTAVPTYTKWIKEPREYYKCILKEFPYHINKLEVFK